MMYLSISKIINVACESLIKTWVDVFCWCVHDHVKDSKGTDPGERQAFPRQVEMLPVFTESTNHSLGNYRLKLLPYEIPNQVT